MGLDYNLNLVDIGAGDQFKPEFLAISPNNRMPAIIDHDGPDGDAISIFESGAILQYLARKSGQFYGTSPRDAIEIDQWLMWQMGGVGPMAGQAHHFLAYAPNLEPPQVIPYAQDRYRGEVSRLYGVLEKQLAGRDYICGDFSIADMAVWPWASLWERQEQDLTQFPNMAAWLDRCAARGGVARGRALAAEKRKTLNDKSAQKNLFKK
ncbi:UNVERIFIED_CONTAM: hypothetical protein GTU68_065610 [Idotea baltica]|nr:hypothetical protein [Idotea baltica]